MPLAVLGLLFQKLRFMTFPMRRKRIAGDSEYSNLVGCGIQDATMPESTTASLTFPEWTTKDVMTEVLRKRAQQILARQSRKKWMDGSRAYQGLNN